MWNPSGARLSPDPVGFHSEALGELVSSKQAIHHLSRRGEPASLTGPTDGPHGHIDAGRRRHLAQLHGTGWTQRLFGGYMVGVSEVAIGARYCVGRVKSLLDKERRPGIAAGFVQAGWEHRGVAPSLRIAIPDFRRRLSRLAERVVADGW